MHCKHHFSIGACIFIFRVVAKINVRGIDISFESLGDHSSDFYWQKLNFYGEGRAMALLLPLPVDDGIETL